MEKYEGHYLIDGFTHPSHKDSFIDLLKAALNWCEDEGLKSCTMEIADTDQEKAELAGALGFKPTGEKSAFKGKYISYNTSIYTIV